MTTDLFFAPALPQKLPSSFQCDRADAAAFDPGHKTDTPGLSKQDHPDNFLKTLKKASRDHNSNRSSRPSESPAAERSASVDRHSENDRVSDPQPTADELLMELLSLLDADELSLKDQPPIAAELKELITLLETMGWTGALADRIPSAEGALTIDNMSSSVKNGRNAIAIFKQVIGDIQSTDLKPGNELSAGLAQLRQIISGALTADSSPANSDIAPDGLERSQSQISVELARWVKGINQKQDLAAANASAAGEGKVTEKPIDLSPVSDRPNAEPASASKNSEIKVLAEVDGAAGKYKGMDNIPGKGLDKFAENEIAGKAAAGHRNAPVGQPSGGESLEENTLKGGSPAVSKALDDATTGKDNALKADPALSGDTGSKVVKSEAGSNDSGQWTSQSQTPEKTAETASTSKEAESAQRELRTQTMDQIVRRALFQVKNGQQEARIDLKPDFLGHVRMQVITENHQVTVKILTEFGFVKDMIENNMHQLKADLQQQGLEVDKLDVSVSRDANGKNQQQENMEQAKKQPAGDQAGDDGNHTGEDPQDQAKRSSRQADGLSTVDYFA